MKRAVCTFEKARLECASTLAAQGAALQLVRLVESSSS